MFKKFKMLLILSPREIPVLYGLPLVQFLGDQFTFNWYAMPRLIAILKLTIECWIYEYLM